MNPISNIAWKFSANARKKRAELFRSFFEIGSTTKILDLGSENGSNIFNVLAGTDVKPENVYIADIDQTAIDHGNRSYGFNPVLVSEGQPLEFEDGYFDIVYCSSVIEHATVPKSDVWKIRSQKEFEEKSWKTQKEFASEIRRLGKQYFVQTPSRSFPIESHTWLPLLGYVPRKVFLPILSVTNRFWVKAAEPDFNLLDMKRMGELFPAANIIPEIKWKLIKSIMAVQALPMT
jgi:SAM-dependent methyltransferase